jgi:hypothetical protein|tara:strand:- start:373 stop:786 length:414 start_codon:yes stop_codon:yes gene_type:complete
MSKFVATGTTVTFNTTDISSSLTRAELVVNSAEVDVTDFGSAGWVEVIGGLKSGTVSLDFQADYGAGAVNELFADLLGTIGTVTIITANGTAASATTPIYTTEVLVNSFTPVSGAVGDLSTWTVTFPTSGPVTYATA